MPYELATSIAKANAAIDTNLSTTAGGMDSLRDPVRVLLLVLNAVGGTMEKWQFPSENRIPISMLGIALHSAMGGMLDLAKIHPKPLLKRQTRLSSH